MGNPSGGETLSNGSGLHESNNNNIIMKFIASLIALAGSAAAAKQTTVTILEFGKGGTVHAAANINNAAGTVTTTPDAMTSFWKAMHPSLSKDGKYSSHVYAGMSVVPDLFAKADMGVIVGLGGNVAEYLDQMPTTLALLSGSNGNSAEKNAYIGQAKIAGHVTNTLIQGVSTPKITAAAAVKVTENQVMNAADAKEADDQLRQLIQRIKEDVSSAANDKTVVVHLVIESVVPEMSVASSANRRRLQEDNQNQQQGNNNNKNQQGNNQNQQQNGQNYNNNNNGGNSNYYYGKTMYEIQTFNVITWTAVGLVVLIFMVIGAFIDMPLMPDTLLFGHSAKMGSD